MLRKLVALALCLTMIGMTAGGLCEMETWDVTNRLSRGLSGVRNPLKGWRADEDLTTRFGTLVRWMVPWNEIESTEADGVEKIIAYGEQHWSTASYRNCKIIPRVYLELPDVATYWPEDMETGDYSSDVFLARVKNLIRKMAAAWDNDPQIAYIEMGLVGWWGEQHTPTPTHEVQSTLLSMFNLYFKNKLVMVRNPQHELFTDSNYGLYWDEWGSDMQWSEWDHIDVVVTEPYKDRWKTAVFGGENTNNLYTYDPTGGRFMTFGCPEWFDEITAFTQYNAEMTKYARLTHTNHMHTRLPAENSGVAWMNACSFQDLLGYGFVLQEARFNHVDAGERALRVSFDVRNMSASPFYYDWPVRVSLLDQETRLPVWSQLVPGVSVKDWLPGDGWQVEEKAYAEPARTYTVEASFILPEEVTDGSYVLAVSIPDPAGLRNAAVFMNTGYIAGGYTALGLVGVGETPEQTLSMGSMNIPNARDEALSYDRNLALGKACDATQLVDGLNVTSWRGTEATIDLGSVRRLSSLTLCFNGVTTGFTVSVSRDGETWTDCDGETFETRNTETHLSLNAARAQWVRISFEEEASLSQVRVYGQ